MTSTHVRVSVLFVWTDCCAEDLFPADCFRLHALDGARQGCAWIGIMYGP